MEGIYVVGFIFLIILAVLWFFLPFAVFGVKERLDTLIKLQKETVQLLRGNNGQQQD